MNLLKQYQMGPVFDVIIESAKNEKKIREEFDKSITYFIEHPDFFMESVMVTKEQLENLVTLNSTEKSSLQAIYNLLDKKDFDVREYFQFKEELLLNNFVKIYKQVESKYPLSCIQNNEEIDILYYTISDDTEFKTEYSKLCLNKLTVKALDFLISYQMLNN